MKENKQWFETWFDSPYYHILYDHRDCDEAEFFINNLLNYLQPEAESSFLDLACGAGRHSKFINSKGYKVVGADLSENSIATAQNMANDSLSFRVHDMRNPLPDIKFDYVFNLFTSFGYFDSIIDNIRVLESIKRMLNNNGTIVIDFMNAKKVINNLVNEEIVVKQEIEFQINRSVVGGQIIKRINFTDKNSEFEFEEKVQALTVKDFTQMCNQVGFSIVKTFGNYSLDEFNEQQSDRLIMVLQ